MTNWLIFFRTRLSDPLLRRLLILLSLAALFIIFINYFTIKILSSARAYINGESQYSKGEKDAAQNLILLLNTREPIYWDAFLRDIQIPQGDSLAREKLLQNSPDEEIRKGFLQGKNHPDDIDNLTWLFKNFKDFKLMGEPIKIWKAGDSLVYQKYKIGLSIKRMIDEGKNDIDEQSKLLKEIVVNSTQMTIKERAFSDNLGHTSRKIGAYLLYFNIFFILVVFLSVKVYATKILNELKDRNIELSNTNDELDKFVYSASHDLRAPISSLKGLVAVSRIEPDLGKIKSYIDLMDQTLDRQDQFIKDIIDYSLNKKQDIELQLVNVASLINEAIEKHLYMPAAKEIKITQELSITEIQSDPKRLSIVINNLVSNSFKYHDSAKEVKTLSFKSRKQDNYAIIEIEDNGIGIPPKHAPHIFEMFYVVNTGSKGSGLGLYITKETINKLGGDIIVYSRINFGTKFTIRLPQPV